MSLSIILHSKIQLQCKPFGPRVQLQPHNARAKVSICNAVVESELYHFILICIQITAEISKTVVEKKKTVTQQMITDKEDAASLQSPQKRRKLSLSTNTIQHFLGRILYSKAQKLFCDDKSYHTISYIIKSNVSRRSDT